MLFDAVLHILAIAKPISNSTVFFRSFLAGSVWQRCSKLETETSIVFVVWKKVKKTKQKKFRQNVEA
jgi:hypothetical protein